MTEKNKNIKGFVVKGLIVLSYVHWLVRVHSEEKREEKEKKESAFVCAGNLCLALWFFEENCVSVAPTVFIRFVRVNYRTGSASLLTALSLAA